MAQGGNRTRSYVVRGERNTTIPPDSLRDLYYLPPVIDDWRGSPTPPQSPAAGDCYVVPQSGQGAWAGYDGQMATWNGQSWTFAVALPGATCYCCNQHDAIHLVDFTRMSSWGGVAVQQLLCSSSYCCGWVPDHIIDQLQGLATLALSGADTSPTNWSSGKPYCIVVVTSTTWPAMTGTIPLGALACSIIDQTTGLLTWAYLVPPNSDTAPELVSYGRLAYYLPTNKFLYYSENAIGGLWGTNWKLLGHNILLEELADVAPPSASTDGWSLVWNNLTSQFVFANIASGTGVNHLYQLLDVAITENSATNGQYLYWNFTDLKWEAGMPKLVQLLDVDAAPTDAMDGYGLVWSKAEHKFILSPAGGSGVKYLYQLLDVSVTDAAGTNGKFLYYNSTDSFWEAKQIAISDIAQSGATTGQVATWTGTAWTPQTPSGGGGGGFTPAGVSYYYQDVSVPYSTIQIFNNAWGSAPLFAVPSGCNYVLVNVRVVSTGTGGIVLKRVNSLGIEYSGDENQLAAYPEASGVFPVVAGDYFIFATFPVTVSSAYKAFIQLTKVG